ncbi:hypothetical protein [Leifsonia kafniensis]|uniref:hypothetical protein n=1 Tax=Leifsonia kafniensis TaxID=475957 RepID=UPI0031ED474B
MRTGGADVRGSVEHTCYSASKARLGIQPMSRHPTDVSASDRCRGIQPAQRHPTGDAT